MDIIQRNFIYSIIQAYRYKKIYQKWLHLGKPIPTPDIVKQMTIKEYASKYKIHVFIETGTYLGDMVFATKNNFYKIYSIELSTELYERAKKKFVRHKHISIIKGDSSKVLPEILNQVEEHCLFWLDSHYSSGITVKGEKETPILEELNHIFNHPIEDHVILIDDARCFTGHDDYPSIEELKALILSRYPNNMFNIEDDIIRTHKNTNNPI